MDAIISELCNNFHGEIMLYMLCPECGYFVGSVILDFNFLWILLFTPVTFH